MNFINKRQFELPAPVPGEEKKPGADNCYRYLAYKARGPYVCQLDIPCTECPDAQKKDHKWDPQGKIYVDKMVKCQKNKDRGCKNCPEPVCPRPIPDYGWDYLNTQFAIQKRVREQKSSSK